MTDFSDGIVGWLVANTKAVPPAPLTAPAKGQQGMFEATRAAVWYGMVWYGMVWYGMVWYTTRGTMWIGWLRPVSGQPFTYCKK